MQEFEGYIKNAIEFCLSTSKDCLKSEDIVACLKSQNPLVHSKFRYAIAREIAHFFTHSFRSHVKSMNLYGSTMEYSAGIYSDIDLILCLSSASQEITDLIKQLNSFLTQSYYSLIGQAADELSYFLDVHIINYAPDERHQPSRAYLEHILLNNSVAL